MKPGLPNNYFMMNHNFLSLTLNHYEDIAPYTRHFIFSADKEVYFIPGQFITLHWASDNRKIYRNYSLANYGGYDAQNPTKIELAATYVENGFASEQLFSMKTGSNVKATGPFGRLTLCDEVVKRYIMVATGAGITPYRTMLSSFIERMEKDPELHILLLFGVRYFQDLLYRDELVRFAQQHTRFTFKVYYSKEKNLKYDYEHSGYVTKAFDDAFSIIPDHDVAYLCGNPKMVDDVYQTLSLKGLISKKIRREKYISPKKN